jgi:hypothetical protein
MTTVKELIGNFMLIIRLSSNNAQTIIKANCFLFRISDIQKNNKKENPIPARLPPKMCVFVE